MPKPKSAPKVTEQELPYPEFEVKAFTVAHDCPMTVAIAKEIIGWETEDDYAERLMKEAEAAGEPMKKKPVVKFGDAYDLKDHHDNKIRLRNNPRNRPFKPALCRKWESEILNRHWKLNGENWIVGKSGQLLSAQHRCCALILAGQEWEKNRDNWSEWDVEPYIECSIAFGVDESDDVVNTIDTGEPRSLSDAIYITIAQKDREFSKLPPKQREKISKATADAVKMFAHRVNAFCEAFNPNNPSHMDAIDLINNHPRLLRAVKHCFDEHGDENKLQKYTKTPGYAAAAMFLMGSSTTSDTKSAEYHKCVAIKPNEEMLDWSMWDKAADFIVQIAAEDKSTSPIRAVLKKHAEAGHTLSIHYLMALLAKSWALVASGKKLSVESITPDSTIDSEFGTILLNEHPRFGGIDWAGEESDVPVAIDEPEEKTETEAVSETNGKKTKSASDLIYVVPKTKGAAPWAGTVVEQYERKGKKLAKVQVAKGFAGAGKVYEVDQSEITTEKPEE